MGLGLIALSWRFGILEIHQAACKLWCTILILVFGGVNLWEYPKKPKPHWVSPDYLPFSFQGFKTFLDSGKALATHSSRAEERKLLCLLEDWRHYISHHTHTHCHMIVRKRISYQIDVLFCNDIDLINWTKKELWFTLEVLHGNQILSSVHLGHKRVWSQSLAETILINSNATSQWLAYLTEASKRPWAKTFRTGKPWLVYHQPARKTLKLSSLRHPKTKECAPKKGVPGKHSVPFS